MDAERQARADAWMLEHAVSRDHDNRGGAGIGEADRYECTYLRPDVLGGLVYAGDSVVKDAGEPIDHLGNNHGEQFVLAGEVVVEGSGRDTCVARRIGDAEPRGPAADKSLSPGWEQGCPVRETRRARAVIASTSGDSTTACPSIPDTVCP